MLSQIAILGLGQMGMAMVENLAKRGYCVCAYNRSKKEVETNDNFLVTSDPKKAIQSSSVVFIALSDGKAISEVLLEKGELKYSFLPGSVVMDTTTHDPEFAKNLHEKFSKLSIAYIDAPVSGGPEKARNGALSIMVGGKRSDYNKYKSYLELIGQDIFYMGQPGAGQTAKLVNQILVGIAQLSTAEAILFGKTCGLDLDTLFKLISCSAGNSTVFQRSAPQMIGGKFTRGFQTYLINKDLTNALKAAKQKKISLAMTSLASQILQKHADNGFRDVDAASIILNYEKDLGRG